MLALSLFIALLLDRLLPDLQDFRSAFPLSGYVGWIAKQSFFKSVPSRLVPYALILPVLLLSVVLNWLFHTALFGLFSLGFYLFIAFLCLEPWVLNEEVDRSLRELESVNSNSGSLIDSLFFQSNRSLYCAIFWMVVAGPVLVVVYRMVEKLNSMQGIRDHQTWKNDLSTIIAWFEWLPALISSYVFMICGNFDAGLKSARNIPVFSINLGRLNKSRLQQVGTASVKIDTDDNNLLTAELLRRCRGMLLRSLVVWLVLAVLLDYWL